MNKFDLIDAIIISPFLYFMKFFNSPIIQKRDLLLKCYNEGLYHLTEEENVSKILESGYLKASSYFNSYGSKKVFMFAGIPSFEEVCSNLGGKTKFIAIKINPTYNQLTDFFYRSKNDYAISYNGDLNLTNKQIEICYLGLYKNNNNLEYKKISKAEYDNYQPNFKIEWMQHKFAFFLKNMEISLLKEYKDTIKYLKNNNFTENKTK